MFVIDDAVQGFAGENGCLVDVVFDAVKGQLHFSQAHLPSHWDCFSKLTNIRFMAKTGSFSHNTNHKLEW